MEIYLIFSYGILKFNNSNIYIYMDKLGVYDITNVTDISGVDFNNPVNKTNIRNFNFEYLEQFYPTEMADIKNDISKGNFYVTNKLPKIPNTLNRSFYIHTFEQYPEFLITYDIIKNEEEIATGTGFELVTGPAIDADISVTYTITIKYIINLKNNKIFDKINFTFDNIIINDININDIRFLSTEDWSSLFYITHETDSSNQVLVLKGQIYQGVNTKYINIDLSGEAINADRIIVDYQKINNKDYIKVIFNNVSKTVLYINLYVYDPTALLENTYLNKSDTITNNTNNFFYICPEKQNSIINQYSTVIFTSSKSRDEPFEYYISNNIGLTGTIETELSNSYNNLNTIFGFISGDLQDKEIAFSNVVNFNQTPDIRGLLFFIENEDETKDIYVYTINSIILHYDYYTFEKQNIFSLWKNIDCNVITNYCIINTLNSNLYSIYNEVSAYIQIFRDTWSDTTSKNYILNITTELEYDNIQFTIKDDKYSWSEKDKYNKLYDTIIEEFGFSSNSKIMNFFNEQDLFIQNSIYNSLEINNDGEPINFSFKINIVNRPLIININSIEKCNMFLKTNDNFTLNYKFLVNSYDTDNTFNIYKYSIGNKELIINSENAVISLNDIQKQDELSNTANRKRFVVNSSFSSVYLNLNAIRYSIMDVNTTLFKINAYSDQFNVENLTVTADPYIMDVYSTNVFLSFNMIQFLYDQNNDYKTIDIGRIKLIDNSNDASLIDKLTFQLNKISFIDYSEIKLTNYSNRELNAENFPDISGNEQLLLSSNMNIESYIDSSYNLYVKFNGIEDFSFNESTNKFTSEYYICVENPFIQIPTYQGNPEDVNENSIENDPAQQFNDFLNLNDTDFNNDINFFNADNDAFGFGTNMFETVFTDTQADTNETIYDYSGVTLLKNERVNIILNSYSDVSQNYEPKIINYYGKYKRKYFLKLEHTFRAGDANINTIQEFMEKSFIKPEFLDIIDSSYTNPYILVEVYNKDFCLINKLNVYVPELGFEIYNNPISTVKTFEDSDTGYPGLGSIDYNIENRKDNFSNISREFQCDNIFTNVTDVCVQDNVDSDNFANFKLESDVFNLLDGVSNGQFSEDSVTSYFSKLKIIIREIQRKRVDFLNSYKDISLNNGSESIKIFNITINPTNGAITNDIPEDKKNIVYKFIKFLQNKYLELGIVYQSSFGVIGTTVNSLKSKQVLSESRSKPENEYLEDFKNKSWVQFVKEEFSLFDFLMSDDILNSNLKDSSIVDDNKFLFLMLFDCYVKVNDDTTPFKIVAGDTTTPYTVTISGEEMNILIGNNYSDDSINIIPSYFIENNGIVDSSSSIIGTSNNVINLINIDETATIKVSYLDFINHPDISAGNYVRVLDLINTKKLPVVGTLYSILNFDTTEFKYTDDSYNKRKFIVDIKDDPSIIYYPQFITPKTTCFYMETLNNESSDSKLVGLTLFSTLTMSQRNVYEIISRTNSTITIKEVVDNDGDGTLDTVTLDLNSVKMVSIVINFY